MYVIEGLRSDRATADRIGDPLPRADPISRIRERAGDRRAEEGRTVEDRISDGTVDHSTDRARHAWYDSLSMQDT